MLKETSKTFLRDLGKFLLLPAILVIPTLVIIIVFKEWFALKSFILMSLISLLAGQLFFRLNKNAKATAPGSARVLLPLVWFLLPVMGAVPFYGIALEDYNPQTEIFLDPHSAFFESMSGFTGTGLTMVSDPSQLPHVLQWWRSLLEWVGGLGVIFLAVILVNTNHAAKNLYKSEAMSWIRDDGEVYGTVKKIWLIYLIYTVGSIAIFLLCGMPWWEAINHGLVGIATGGFSVNKDSFVSYSPLIKGAAVFIMIMGALSFKIHYLLIIRRQFLRLTRQTELGWFSALFAGLVAVMLFANDSYSFVDNLFQASSALGTCGFNSIDVEELPVPILFLLMIPMFIGGNESSTTGGIKTSRLIWLFKSLRKSLLQGNRDSAFFFNGERLPPDETSSQLRQAGILFFLYVAALVMGSLILLILPGHSFSLYEILFDVTSALNNVGLSSGLTGHENPVAVKWVLILLMWLGRLEIQVVLLLLLVMFSRRGLHDAG